ncbi:(Lyso)-N-acylphosphatidylethanolamine lipase isoform X2 [Cyprinodon tularosa]|uniref:(Lyso)-N-acylphosphatidylethanolamine lipase n=1 Tax=Cyprinodon variegatus TaxID=28743 RepID=A0A3Q2E0E3_CYPVA|nr:PREDICTED: abhydrolase domain-containing protein 4 isoform X2 [Cyprinodon variegatus]XP_038156469.1 (Lyso)-N-acylphosphatidylethanolamine lipase isoform X2 [Cyprinodon tularosa]
MDPAPAPAPMQNNCETESGSIWSWWPSWRPTSMSLLKTTESKILACIKNDLWARFVTLQNQDRIWTLSLTNKGTPKSAEQAPKTPLVMVHGFGGGVGLWIRNLDALSRSRTVYAFDLLGFGRSSRPPFPSDPAKAEEQFVDSIEQWRQAVGLESMILLGHSLGGYLATSYAIQHPSRVSHLILVDPWGFPERPKPESQQSQDQGSEVVKRPGPPRWAKAIISIFSLFNPLAVIRAAGPWGPGLVNRFRPDFKRKFEDLFDDDTMTQYIYHCNAQTPSGEVGFRAMSETLGWAKRPMLQRVNLLSPSMPVTMLYGARSWVDSSSGDRAAEIRCKAYTKVLLIDNASHHVYADEPEVFNKVVENICKSVD